jgi:hypothetical protein
MGRIRTRKREQLGNFRDAEIFANCEGHMLESDWRHTQEMRSPTGTYTEVYVGKNMYLLTNLMVRPGDHSKLE